MPNFLSLALSIFLLTVIVIIIGGAAALSFNLLIGPIFDLRPISVPQGAGIVLFIVILLWLVSLFAPDRSKA